MAFDEPDEMVWEKMWVGRPGGTHLSQSRTSGGFSPLVRGDGTNILETHATLLPDGEEDGQDLLGKALLVAVGIAVGVVGAIAVVKAAPRIKSRLKGFNFKWGDSAEKSTTGSRVDVVLNGDETSMSSEEARGRLLALLAAAAFVADQVRVLGNARIEDDGASPELEGAMGNLALPQIMDSIDRMIEANASLLDEEVSVELMKIFGSGGIVAEQHVSLRNEKIKDVLGLTGGEA